MYRIVTVPRVSAKSVLAWLGCFILFSSGKTCKYSMHVHTCHTTAAGAYHANHLVGVDGTGEEEREVVVHLGVDEQLHSAVCCITGLSTVH